jgi:protein-tyrosine-phosphatase
VGYCPRKRKKKMTLSEIAEKAAAARRYAKRIPDPSMSNYKSVMDSYKSVLDRVLELIEELGAHIHENHNRS